MPREADRTARQSVLDRLIDRDRRAAADPPGTWSASVRQLKASLMRDLEWLLNTRRIVEPAADAYPEVQHSVYHFGLPDITSLSAESEVVRQRLVRQIEECIELFEPRLTAVQAYAVESEEGSRRQVRFVIEGLLKLDPDPERVVFDTVLETVTGRFVVSGAADA